MSKEEVTRVKQYVVYLPLNQHTALKISAAKRNIPISDIFKDLVTNYLKGEK